MSRLFTLFFVITVLFQSVQSQEIEIRPNVIVFKMKQAEMLAPASGASIDDYLDSIGATKVLPFITNHASTAERFSDYAKRELVRKYEQEVSRIRFVEYSSEKSPWTVAREMAQLPGIEYAEPWILHKPLGGTLTPNDSLFASQAFLKTIKAEEAWDVTQGSTSVVIGIADTDVKWDHPDLQANIWSNPGESGTDGLGRDKRTNGVDDDNNGFIDDWHGWDFAGADNNSPDNDTRSTSGGHGTAVAGLAGAVTDNRFGIASIGNRCKLLPMKIGADAGGNLPFGYQAMDYASRMGAKIFNASWGGFGFSQSGQDVINLVRSRGMVVVGGAGNHGGTTPFYPAAYDGVLSAGVANAQDVISNASGYGPPIDVISPGDGALTTNINGGYSGFGATSAAAPIVSGLAGLVASHFTQYSEAQIRERIRVTCDNIDAKNPTRVKYAGKGRINAYRAVSDPATPSLRVTGAQFRDQNNDKRFDVGESIELVLTLQNYLDDTGQPVTLTVVPIINSGNISLTKDAVTIGAIRANGTGSNGSEPFTFIVEPSSNYDARVVFRVDIQSGSYEDFDFVDVPVNPSYRTMQSNQLSMTIQANGMLGFKDYPTNTLGEIMKLGAADLQLFLGTAMIGVDEQHIVDNGRTSTDFLNRIDDFAIIDPVTISQNVGGARAKAFSRFSDANAAAARKLNVEVIHEVYDYSNLGINDVLFSKFTVKNTGTSALRGLRFSLFMDFGGFPTYYSATPTYDSTLHFGYVTKSGFPYVGTFVIDSLPLSNPSRSTFWAINNDHRVSGNPFGTLDGFTYAEKWRAMSTYAGNHRATAGNIAYVLTAPVADIDTGASHVFVFGHHANTGFTTLRNNVTAAIQFWRNSRPTALSAIESAAGFSISDVYPNPSVKPVVNQTIIRLHIKDGSRVELSVVNVLGQVVRRIESLHLEPGSNTISFTTSGLAPGMHFVRAIQNGVVLQRPFVILH